MIKIIKNGIIPKKYKTIYIFDCRNCRCEFEFEEEDCKTVTTEKGINGIKAVTIDCPCCGEEVEGDLNKCTSRQEEIIEDPVDFINIGEIYQWSPSLCKCPKCGRRNALRNDSIVLTSIPPQYNFKCDACGHEWVGHESVFINTKVGDVWENEHCKNCPHKNTIDDICSCCAYYPYRVTCSNEVDENE